jgi:polyisoprenoid-binding protein YceI
VHIDEDIAKSPIKVVIKADSIDTRQEMRDAHLRSNDFLAMEEYPELTFESTTTAPLSPTAGCGRLSPASRRRCPSPSG